MALRRVSSLTFGCPANNESVAPDIVVSLLSRRVGCTVIADMPTKGSMPLALLPDPDLEKKKAAARSWLLLDANGDSMMLEVDKYAVMHRVGIHARDLRILDPLLSYPSTILGRERAIVLNLEVDCLILASLFRCLFYSIDSKIVSRFEDTAGLVVFSQSETVCVILFFFHVSC